MKPQHSFPILPVTRGIEIQCIARELTRSLGFGDELSMRRARRQVAVILHEATAIQQSLNSTEAA